MSLDSCFSGPQRPESQTLKYGERDSHSPVLIIHFLKICYTVHIECAVAVHCLLNLLLVNSVAGISETAL